MTRDKVDLKDDRFDVTFNPGRVSVDALLDAIRKLEFEPVVVKSASMASKSGPNRVDISTLPEALAKLLAKAGKANKPVLLRFSGPG